jgi:archaellum biogenesis ATPase FlaH
MISVSTELKSKTPPQTPELPPEKKEELYEKYSKSHPIILTTTFRNTAYDEPKWLVNRLIRTGGISFIVGESGTGKTIAALTIAKALSTGEPWLEKFETTKSNVLILDKENEPSDIQKHFSTMGIVSDNIHLLFTPNNYNLMDEKVKKTEIAEYISLYIKKNKIDVVIMDSIIDFTIGDESNSGDVAKNINVWREIISPASILAIHHFKKADPRQTIKAADMMRGSSVWLSSAQSVLALTVPTFGKSTILAVESVKVRSGKKQPPFQMEMVIRPDPFIPNETIVDGFKYLHEINEVKLKIDDAKEAIVKLLSDNPELEYTATEIKALLAPNGITEKNVDSAIPQLVAEGEVYNSSGNGTRGSPKAYKMCVTSMLEKAEKENEI